MTTIETRELRGKPHLKNVLLIVPKSGVYAGFKNLVQAEPLGPECVGGALTELAESVEIIDERVTPGKWREAAAEHPPEMVGISCNYTADVPQAIELITQVRHEMGKEVLIVTGGHHVTHRPEDFFIKGVDAIVLGEGEKPIQDIVQAWNEKRHLENVPSICYLNKEGKFIKNPREKDTSPPVEFNSPHMNNRPFPRRDLVEENRKSYYFLYYPQYSIETSRGCPNKCSFCSVWPFYRGKIKVESPTRTIHEIVSLGENAKYINIIDDAAFSDIDGAEKIADELIRLGIKKRYWAQVRTETIWPEDPEERKHHLAVIEKWVQAGLDTVLIGFESFKPGELDRVHKKSDVEQSIEVINFLGNLGVRIWPGEIAFPEWTRKDFDQAIENTQKFKFAFPQLTNLTPLPGSVDYKNAGKKGLLLTDDPALYNFLDWVIATPNLTPEQMRSETLRFYRETGAFGRTPDGKLVNLVMAKRAMRRMREDVREGITTEARIAEFNKRYAAFLRGETPEETVIFEAGKS